MPRTPSPPRKPLLAFASWLILLVAVNLAARLPLCWDPATVDNDGAEYLAITRQLRTTGQYATDLKWQFYTPDPVYHAAWADRPPLYPYFALLCQRALPHLPPTAAARLGNALLAMVALLLCAVYLRRLFGERIALAATGFAFLLPHTLKWTTQPMTETVTLALTFAALLAWEASYAPQARQGHPGGAFLCGLLCGLAYLARPTGALLLLVFVADHLYRAITGPEKARGARTALTYLSPGALLTGFGLCAAPYHLQLWRDYGNPFYSALGFTFAVKTYYEVTYYGFEAPRPTVGNFLRQHWAAVPGLILHQVWRHVQILVPQLLPFLPFSLALRRSDWLGRRAPAAGLIGATLLVHTLTWSAWGSSRYFLPCLPLAIAFLLAGADRVRSDAAAWPWLRRLAVAIPGLAGVGLAGCLVAFYATFAAPDRGLAGLPAWREAAGRVKGAGLIASDKPSILNLLLETPAVRLPRTTDPEQLARFLHAYRPGALVLFPDEAAERPMAQAWRAGRLPAGWRLDMDTERLLILRPEPGGGEGRSNSASRREMRQAGAASVVN